MSLYLKYRPKNFEDVVGQDHIKKTLSNAIKNNNLSHAYLFSGPRGTGKTSTARLIAKAICCGTREDLKEMADQGRLVDLIEIDAASNRGIDEIRDLREKIQFAPVMSPAKVYIIDEVHMLTKEAFNALLKTLEEPPAHAFFILATTEIHKIPETILSRCQHFAFQRISEKELADRLEYICQAENFSCEREALEMIADNANGGMRDAISSLEQMVFQGSITSKYVQDHLGIVGSKVVESFAEELIAGKAKNTLQAIERLTYEGFDLSQFAKELIERLRESMILEVQKGRSPKRIIEVLEAIQEAALKIKSAVIPQLPLEVACIKTAQDLTSETPENNKASGNFFGVFGAEKEKKIPEKKESSNEVISKEIIKEAPQKSAENLELSLDTDTFKEQFPKIAENIQSPTVKVAFKNAKVLSVLNQTVQLAASTDFYFETLHGNQGILELTKAIESLFHQKVKIHIERGENTIQLTPESAEIVKKKEPENSNFMDMANEIFGNN